MTAKAILFDDVAQGQITAGVNALANTVKLTLGPRGRNVVIDRSYGGPLITKDGVTVAKEIELDNPFENMGAQMVKEVASKTADVAGDGTTTATVLAQAIYTEGVRLVAAGLDPMELKRGIEAAVAAVVTDLQRQSKPTQSSEEIAQVGTISANGDATIGALIAEAMDKVGEEGIITIEEAQVIETTLEVVPGMQFDRGYLSPYFVTDPERMEAVLDEPYLLVVGKKVSSMQELLPVLELVANAGKPLLVIASDVDGEALATLVVNKLRGTMAVCAVKAPGYGDRQNEMIQDIAVLTGAKAVTDDLGVELADMTLADLGHAKKVIVDKDNTTIVEGAGDEPAVTMRVKQLRAQLEGKPSSYDEEKLRERLAKLAAGVAVIKVGGASELELKEKKDRVEDALHATRAAVAEGIVPGGGVSLVRAAASLKKVAKKLSGDRLYGLNIVRRALEEPLRQIAKNGGLEGAIVVRKVLQGKGSYGYNAATDSYEDLVAAGVIDPTQVVRVALQNAASVASLMLTTSVVIAAQPDDGQAGADVHSGLSPR